MIALTQPQTHTQIHTLSPSLHQIRNHFSFHIFGDDVTTCTHAHPILKGFDESTCVCLFNVEIRDGISKPKQNRIVRNVRTQKILVLCNVHRPPLVRHKQHNICTFGWVSCKCTYARPGTGHINTHHTHTQHTRALKPVSGGGTAHTILCVCCACTKYQHNKNNLCVRAPRFTCRLELELGRVRVEI